MLESALILAYEVLILSSIFFVLAGKRNVEILRPMLLLFGAGIIVEMLSFLSVRELSIFPVNTNTYTYPLLTLIELWSGVWLAWRFTEQKKQLLFAGGVFTALWIAAKLSVEPLHLFDSTTFSLLTLSTLVFVGRSAQNLANDGFRHPAVRGLYWIFAGFAAYALLSLTIATVVNMLEQGVRAKMWWMNNAAFALKTACIVKGILSLGTAKTNTLATLQDANTKDFLALSGGMVVLFLVKYFLFPATTQEAEFSAVVIFTAIPVAAWYVYNIGRAAYKLFFDEAVKREMAEKLRIAENMSSEESADQISDSIAIIATIVAEKLPDEANNKVQTQITRIIGACLSLLHRERFGPK